MPRINTTTFERNLRKLLSEEKEAEEQLSELQEHLADIRKRLAAYRLVSEECVGISAENGAVKANELYGKSLNEALVMIAKHNDGELNVYHARPLLRSAGVLKGDSRSVSSRLHDALANSEQFQQTGERGRWSLLDEPSASNETEAEPATQTHQPQPFKVIKDMAQAPALAPPPGP